MEKINFKKEKVPFTQVANEVLNNPQLSAKAKGVYSYLYSKPDGWNFESGRIAKDFTDGRDSIRTALKELEDEGYLKRYKTPIGRMVYALASKPMTENPSQEPMTEKANDGKSHSGKTRRISNKEGEVIKSISNKENSEQSSPELKVTHDEGYDVDPTLVSDVIKLFEDVDPKNKTYYGNKTQRKASAFLIGEYGLEEITKRISVLSRTNKIPFFPTITTPVHLRDKWVQLNDAVERKREELKAKQPQIIL